MKIIFNGLSYFGKRLVRDLNDFAPQHSFSFIDTYTSTLEQVKFASALPFADLVVSLNGVTDKSGSLELVLKMKKKLWMQWQGSDSMMALENFKNKNIERKYIDYATHYCIAPWIGEELKEIGINCTLLTNQWINPPKLDSPAFRTLAVYTYFPQNKEEFYGWDIVNFLAEKNPNIPFSVFGTNGKGLKKFPNTEFLGFVSDEKMRDMQVNLPIYIRLTKHDGYSYLVIETLSNGGEVIWSMPHEKCHFLNTMEKAENVFSNLVEKLQKRNLTRNQDSIEYIRQNFSKEKVLGQWLEKIETLERK